MWEIDFGQKFYFPVLETSIRIFKALLKTSGLCNPETVIGIVITYVIPLDPPNNARISGRKSVSRPHHGIQGPAQCLTPERTSKDICSMNDCLKGPFYLFFCPTPRWKPSSPHLTTDGFPWSQASLALLQSAWVNCQLTFNKTPPGPSGHWLITHQVSTPLPGFQVLE